MCCGLLLFSCIKEKDEIYPTIDIQGPADGATYNVFDTIFVALSISDDQNLDWVQVDVINDFNQSIVPPETNNSIEGNSTEYLEALILDNIHLESGNFFLRVRAFDGENEKTEFVDITIIEHPRALERFIVVSSPTAFTTSIDSLLDNTLYNASVLDIAYDESEINSWHRELLIGGKETGNVQVLTTENLLPSHAYSGEGNSIDDWYKDMHFDVESLRYFLSREDSKVDSRRQYGIAISSFDTAESLQPETIGTTDDMVIVEERNPVSSATFASAYRKSTGTLHASLAIDARLETIHGSGDKAICFGNWEGNGRILKFDVGGSGNVSLIHEFSSSITEAQHYSSSTGNEIYLVVLDDEVLGFNVLSPFSIYPNLQWNIDADEIDIDVVSSAIYARQENTLYELVPGNATPIHLTNLPSGTEAIHLMYNK